ncbi:hypothetical protein BURC_02512 [Burkholderiaceae bacterium]|nr:hypothetical protein BURC_02512 [Burkholderiaceae bacterium]
MTPAVFNATPFAQQCMLLMDKHGQLFFAIIVCATYGFDDAGEPVALREQPPVPLGDEPYGEPGRASLRRASVASAAKPAVDFIVQASAHAPQGRPVAELAVGVRVGTWRKVLQVVGDRQWSGVLGNKASAPRPFVTMPLRYERAFGGSLFDDEGLMRACHAPNPVGVGWKSARPMDPAVASELPNIELPGQRLESAGDEIAVAGLGATAPNWAPRVQFAGTCDKRWVDTRCPVPPADIDDRFRQCAPLDQQWPDAMPNADVQLVNLTPEGRWHFRMPSPEIGVSVLHSGGIDNHRLRVDTVHVDAENKTVSLIARHCLTDIRRLGLVRDVVIGEASPAWLRARRGSKRYIGRCEPVKA